jgi:S-adenosylmethionine:tRNA ribosyltransferase-isomerase
MIAASVPVQRAPDAKLLVIARDGTLTHWRRSGFVELFRPGDVVIANDAATLPASLTGRHVASGQRIELRLAGRDSLARDEVRRFRAVLFGSGDFRTRTEDRPLPPPVTRGDLLSLGPLRAVITEVRHPRLIGVEFDGGPREIWEGIARHGRPIQYAHVPQPLALWDTWTPIAGPPVAFEPPSAGFAIDWTALAAMSSRGVRFATLTHAAGISSTGDPALDAQLPFDEPYAIPERTARLIARANLDGGRVVAIGTTVVRALEDAARHDGRVAAGDGIATVKIGPTTELRVVDALLSGTHEAGTSHYELLRAFVDDDSLRCIDHELNSSEYRTHEFGDSLLIERQTR